MILKLVCGGVSTLLVSDRTQAALEGSLEPGLGLGHISFGALWTVALQKRLSVDNLLVTSCLTLFLGAFIFLNLYVFSAARSRSVQSGSLTDWTHILLPHVLLIFFS